MQMEGVIFRFYSCRGHFANFNAHQVSCFVRGKTCKIDYDQGAEVIIPRSWISILDINAMTSLLLKTIKFMDVPVPDDVSPSNVVVLTHAQKAMF